MGAAASRAEVVSFTGASEVRLTQFVGAVSHTSNSDVTRFPEDVATLPAQAVTRITATDGDFPSAAAAAAQFADPTTALGENPEEFAINLTLNSISPSVRYEAVASAKEVREIRFSAGELGFGSNLGDQAVIRGRLFLDGALTLIAVEPDRDLSAAHATLNVTVVQTLGAQTRTVFSGSVSLQGTAAGDAVAESTGDFPTGQIVLTDLSVFNEEFDRFRVLVIPDLTIDYDFDAVVGQATTLTATVEVVAANVEDNVGVSAVIGTPTTTLDDVLTVSRGAASANRIITALQSERFTPTGDLAFPSVDGFNPAAPFCGLLGFESLLLLCALAGAKRVRLRRAG